MLVKEGMCARHWKPSRPWLGSSLDVKTKKIEAPFLSPNDLGLLITNNTNLKGENTMAAKFRYVKKKKDKARAKR